MNSDDKCGLIDRTKKRDGFTHNSSVCAPNHVNSELPRIALIRINRDYEGALIDPGTLLVSRQSNSALNHVALEKLLTGPPQIFAEHRRTIQKVFDTGKDAIWQFTRAISNFERHYSGILSPESIHSSSNVGEVESILGVALDISPYLDTISDLEESNARKHRFLAIVAHEMRNPLSTIVSGLKVIELRNHAEDIAGVSAMMRRQTEYMSRLVGDLLDMTRQENGQFSLKKEVLQATQVLDLAIETSRASIARCNHQLEITLPVEPIVLHGDLIRLAQAIGNLLDNAAKYTPSGGVIKLISQRVGESFVVRIEDSGVGIPIEQQQDIFQIFTQLDGMAADYRGGLGIGLYLVKSIVVAHGGEIGVSSEGPNKGSIFTVTLPVAIPR